MRELNSPIQEMSQSDEGGEEDGPTRAAIYARTSSPNQRFGYSLDEQVDRCWDQCQMMDWEVRYIHKDEAESGKDIERPHFQMMMGQAEAGAFDVIVFWKLDRFCRSLIDMLEVEEQLREWGVALHSVTEQIDTTSPVGRFNFRNLASAAELERDMISQRSRMGMHALAKQHKWPNKVPPLGYKKKDGGKLEIDNEEADLVRRIFLMYIDKKSMPQVAFELNEENIRTKKGKEWNARAVRGILKNELYIGEYEVAGFEDHVEEYRIIEDSLFEKATETRNRFKKKEGAKRGKMPEERKKKKLDRILNQYHEFLDEMEEESEENFEEEKKALVPRLS